MTLLLKLKIIGTLVIISIIFYSAIKIVTYSSVTKRNAVKEIPLSLKEHMTKARSFDDLFRKIETISLSDSMPIGVIRALDVSSKGDFLVTDSRGQQVLLFDKLGKLINILSPENIHPGLKWRPIKSKFSPDDHIIVSHAGAPSLFLFSSTGTCIAKVDLPSYYPRDFHIDNLMNIYGYNLDYAGKMYLSKVDYSHHKLQKFGTFPRKYKNYISRMSEGGGITVDSKGYIYQVNVSGPEIYKYSPQGKLVTTYKRKPDYYKQLESDIPDFTNAMDFMQKFRKGMKDVTQTWSIHLLTPDILLLQYFVPSGNGKAKLALDLCSINGEYLLKSDIFFKYKIMAARNGRIYSTRQPKSQKNDYLPNPEIDIFEFNVKQ